MVDVANWTRTSTPGEPQVAPTGGRFVGTSAALLSEMLTSA
jgi:hypothetical protein